MEQKQRFFIHDRKEAAVLVLLAVMVAMFAFTLGIHLGKRVASAKGAANPLAVASPLAEAPAAEPEVVGEPQTLASGSPPAASTGEEAVEDTATQALRDEVARTGIKLDRPRQVNLPEKPVSKNAGATTGTSESGEESPEHASRRPPVRPAGVPYALQVGSFATRGEARAQASALSQQGVGARVQAARVPGKGMRYRVFLGDYASPEQARKAGERLSARGLIDSYVVARPEAASGRGLRRKEDSPEMRTD